MAKEVSVKLSLREVRVIMRALSLAEKVSYNYGKTGFGNQSAVWRSLCDAERKVKYGLADFADSIGYAWGAGYGVAQKWFDEKVDSVLPSGKAVA